MDKNGLDSSVYPGCFLKFKQKSLFLLFNPCSSVSIRGYRFSVHLHPQFDGAARVGEGGFQRGDGVGEGHDRRDDGRAGQQAAAEAVDGGGEGPRRRPAGVIPVGVAPVGRRLAADDGDAIVVPLVVIDTPAWVVVQAEADGVPGAILGQTWVPAGVNRGVLVTIDPGQVTETLYVTLHMDGGELELFEYPDGPDLPLQRNRTPVRAPFRVLAVPAG